MPPLNLRRKFYDELIRRGIDPVKIVNDLVEKYLKEVK